MIETLFGGIFGGVLRLAPEVLKFMDRGGERKHELAMLGKQIELDKLRGEQALALARADAEEARETFDGQALLAALQGQFKPTGIPWVDALSSVIRPVLTIYWCIFLYSAYLWAAWSQLKAGGLETGAAIVALWGPDEKALVGAIFAFWFADRSLRKRFAK